MPARLKQGILVGNNYTPFNSSILIARNEMFETIMEKENLPFLRMKMAWSSFRGNNQNYTSSKIPNPTIMGFFLQN